MSLIHILYFAYKILNRISLHCFIFGFWYTWKIEKICNSYYKVLKLFSSMHSIHFFHGSLNYLLKVKWLCQISRTSFHSYLNPHNSFFSWSFFCNVSKCSTRVQCCTKPIGISLIIVFLSYPHLFNARKHTQNQWFFLFESSLTLGK